MQKCLQHEPKARPSVDDLLKIQYNRKSKIRIPDAILLKIKNALQEDEWREFTEVRICFLKLNFVDLLLLFGCTLLELILFLFFHFSGPRIMNVNSES